MMHKNKWNALDEHYEQISSIHMRELFNQDSLRTQKLSVEDNGFYLDFSKNRVSEETLTLLFQLAKDCGLAEKRDAMFAGAAINNTENRSVLHTALRQPKNAEVFVNGENVVSTVHNTLDKMERLIARLNSGEFKGHTDKAITDIVSIGIGGSFLGPKIMSEALSPYKQSIKVHFVANIDAHHISSVLSKLNPDTTLVMTSSKSFTTQETLENSLLARQWLLDGGIKETDLAKHTVGITSNNEAAIKFGIAEENIFPMWDWVGGRYSVWSAIGLPLAICIGFDNFKQMLAGAHSMDRHFLDTPFEQNLPVILAMLGAWYVKYFNAQSQVLLTYHHDLRGFPAYVQQLDMESNGKSTQINGAPTDGATGPIIWGGEGTNGQHAFHQLMHQGSPLIPADFIIAKRTKHNHAHMHQALASNCFAQSQALMQGKTLAEAQEELAAKGLTQDAIESIAPHKVMPGNKPSNTLIMDEVTPFNLGRLIAMYEHKVFCQGVIWNINSFDQWGVELGKVLSDSILPALRGETSGDFDSSTQTLINQFNA